MMMMQTGRNIIQADTKSFISTRISDVDPDYVRLPGSGLWETAWIRIMRDCLDPDYVRLLGSGLCETAWIRIM